VKSVEYPGDIHGKCLGYPWEMPGISMGNAWDIHGKCLGYPWEMPGISMGNAWDIHKKCLGYPWEIPRISVEIATETRTDALRVSLAILQLARNRSQCNNSLEMSPVKTL
jgi:hypothetical protein